eukprot:s509_g25.t1
MECLEPSLEVLQQQQMKQEAREKKAAKQLAKGRGKGQKARGPNKQADTTDAAGEPGEGKSSEAKQDDNTEPSKGTPDQSTGADKRKRSEGDTGAANKKQKKAEARSVASFKLVLVYDAYVSRSGN